MDSDNLGRIFAPTLFRPYQLQQSPNSSPTTQSQSSNIDPMMIFVEVNLQKTILKHLISTYMNKNTVLKLSTIKLTNKMLTRLNRGGGGGGGNEENEVEIVEEMNQKQSNPQIESKEIELDEIERRCIVSYDLRKTKLFSFNDSQINCNLTESEGMTLNNHNNNNNNNINQEKKECNQEEESENKETEALISEKIVEKVIVVEEEKEEEEENLKSNFESNKQLEKKIDEEIEENKSIIMTEDDENNRTESCSLIVDNTK